MADNCTRCGQKVKSEENWMRAHLSNTGRRTFEEVKTLRGKE